MRGFHRRCYLRTIAVLSLNGIRQTGITGTNFQFQRAAPDRKTLLEYFKSRVLFRIECQFVVE